MILLLLERRPKMVLTSLQARLTAQMDLTVGKTGDFSSPKAAAGINRVLNFALGAGAINASNEIWYSREILAISGTNDHLMDATVLNPFGETVNFDLIRAILIINQSDIAWSTHVANTTSVLTIGGDVDSVPFLSPVTATLDLHAGDIFLLTRNTAAGINVTGGTGDVIQVANSAIESLYDIVVIGDKV